MLIASKYRKIIFIKSYYKGSQFLAYKTKL